MRTYLRLNLEHFHFNFGKYAKHLFSHFLVMSLIISAVVGNYAVKGIVNARFLPNSTDDAVLILDLPSPSPSVEPKVTPKATQTPNAPKPVQGGSANPLCKGITAPWTMVPDPSHEGEYVICNTVAEKMATTDELNVAQNNYRQNHGLNTLNIDSALCKVAGERAHEIAGNFSHDGFETAIDRNHISYSAVGENIASGPLTGVHFVEWAWDRSPGHKANMLGDWSRGCGGVYSRFAVFIFAK